MIGSNEPSDITLLVSQTAQDQSLRQIEFAVCKPLLLTRVFEREVDYLLKKKSID